MKAIILTIVCIVVVGAAAYFLYFHHPAPQSMEEAVVPSKAATFDCADGKSITALFYPDADTHVDLSLSDGRSLSVAYATSASGARYANEDESFVFWNKGDTAFIEENGTTTFRDCAVQQ
jgi:membrane-bound inhibitor of C-type lysozyme